MTKDRLVQVRMDGDLVARLIAAAGGDGARGVSGFVRDAVEERLARGSLAKDTPQRRAWLEDREDVAMPARLHLPTCKCPVCRPVKS